MKNKTDNGVLFVVRKIHIGLLVGASMLPYLVYRVWGAIQIDYKVRLSAAETRGREEARADCNSTLHIIAEQIQKGKIPHTNHRWHEYRFEGEQWHCCDCGTKIKAKCYDPHVSIDTCASTHKLGEWHAQGGHGPFWGMQ